MDALPNLLIDISARTPELGRQPYTARAFFLKYADRILFGTDLLPEVEMYRLYYRFLETADEYFRISLARLTAGPLEYLWHSSFLRMYCARSIGKTH